MQRGENDNDYLSDNFWKGKPIDDDRSSEKIANSFGNQFAHLFTDEESITPQMPKIFEQKHLNASSPTPNEMVIYSAPIMAFIITPGINIAKGTLGLAILRYSNNSHEDELLLYTASKKIELRQKLHPLFYLKANNQQVIFDDSHHNQWLLSFADINAMIVFVANVLNSVCRQSGRRSMCQLSAGEGEEVTIGHSVLFDVTHFKEIEGGRLEEFKKDVSVKMKITKKIAETNQWQQTLIGMKRGAMKVVALPEFIGCITLKKLKLAKGKSPETREGISGSMEAILSSDVDVKNITATIDEPEHKEKDAQLESSLMERMARIGQALPVLSNVAVRHENTSNESTTKAVENIHEESEIIAESEVEKLNAEAKSHPTPSPAPRQHFAAHEGVSSCGMSLEMFYRTFALELDRLHDRMEMSFTRILHNELDAVKAEVDNLRKKLSDNVDQLNSSIDEIRCAVKALSNDPTKERLENLASSSFPTTVGSLLEHLMDRFAGEGIMELSQVRDILRETISAEQSEQH